MMNRHVIVAILFLFACACNNTDTINTKQDPLANKTLYISVDESFEPVMTEQIKVFQSAYPEVTVVADYKPEAECLRDLEKDSTKIIIISRELSRDETKLFDTNIEFKPQFDRLAKDAVAVIINTATKDSVFTMNDLRQLLSGSGPQKLSVAIDGNTATSTVRYLKDFSFTRTAFRQKYYRCKKQ